MLIRGAVHAALSGCCLVAADAALLAAFWTEGLDWSVALAGHLALSLVVALAGRPGSARPGRQGTVLQLAAWTALLGPFGALIGMTLVLPRGDVRGDAGDEAGAGAPSQGIITLGAEGDAVPGRLEALHNTLLDSRLRLGGARSVRPLLDILIEGTTAEKLDALGLIAKRYVPALAPALRRGLQDTDASVRVLAATVIAQLHNSHTKRIGTLQEAMLSGSAPAAWRALGEARLAYAASGLLEADRARRETDEGQACLERANALEFADGQLNPARPDGASDAALLEACDAA
jgi:hypothetical protein